MLISTSQSTNLENIRVSRIEEIMVQTEYNWRQVIFPLQNETFFE